MIQGLHHELVAKLGRLIDIRARMAEPALSPQEEHSLNWELQDLDRAAAKLMNAIGEVERMVRDIGGMIVLMTNAPHNSAHWTLAIRHLEDAQSRLLRELGDKTPPAETKDL